jgi:hypothetical protein
MSMEENVGLADRMLRFVFAIIFIILGFKYSWWWFLPAAIALITGLLGWCGLYTLLKCNTCTPTMKSAKTVKVPSKAASKKKKSSKRKK